MLIPNPAVKFTYDDYLTLPGFAADLDEVFR